MKMIFGILSVCFVLITACILYLARSGVVIRSQPFIRPTAVSADFRNVPEHLFLRLFPDFQSIDYVVWGIDMNSAEDQQLLSNVKERYEKQFSKPVQLLMGSSSASVEALKSCVKPCWVILGLDEAHSLKKNSFIEQNVASLGADYFTVTRLSFDRVPEESPEECVTEKRLDAECLKWVSLVEEKKKIRKLGEDRFFLLRKYLDHDYFLLVGEKR